MPRRKRRFNDVRKVAARVAEKWRPGWPKSGGQGGRKVAARRPGWPKSGGQAARVTENGGQGAPKMEGRVYD